MQEVVQVVEGGNESGRRPEDDFLRSREGLFPYRPGIVPGSRQRRPPSKRRAAHSGPAGPRTTAHGVKERRGCPAEPVGQPASSEASSIAIHAERTRSGRSRSSRPRPDGSGRLRRPRGLGDHDIAKDPGGADQLSTMETDVILREPPEIVVPLGELRDLQ